MQRTVEDADPLFSAPHLRIHKSLELHCFDLAGKLLRAMPLKDKLVQISIKPDSMSGVVYQLAENINAIPFTEKTHFSIELPFAESQYYDPDDEMRVVPIDNLKYVFGFRPDPTFSQQRNLVGIGTVDIADISTLPDYAQSRQNKGCNPFGWLLPSPPSSAQFHPRLPDGFPESILPRFEIEFNICLKLPTELEVGTSMLLGAFMAQEKEGGPEIPFLFVAYQKSQVMMRAGLL